MNLSPLYSLRYTIEEALQSDGLELYELINTSVSALQNIDFKPYIDFYTYSQSLEEKCTYPYISTSSLDHLAAGTNVLNHYLTTLFDIQKSKSKKLHSFHNHSKSELKNQLKVLLIKITSLITYIMDDVNVRRFHNIPDTYSQLVIDSNSYIYYRQVDDESVYVFPYYTSYNRTSISTTCRLYARGDTWFEPDKLVSQHIWPEDFI